MRGSDGAPTYRLTDNERTGTMDHVAGIAVRHPKIVAVGGHYGIAVASCVPADPETKGGSEATVWIAKADLVPTDANMRADYTCWARTGRALRDFHGRGERPGAPGDTAGADRELDEEQRLCRLPERRKNGPIHDN